MFKNILRSFRSAPPPSAVDRASDEQVQQKGLQQIAETGSYSINEVL
ncbi:MAG TPA: hypothetical protein VMV94_05540 [Phycisphaerae bacterium]|nr:hypothetical protein [Phycisphaerae bacterium]